MLLDQMPGMRIFHCMFSVMADEERRIIETELAGFLSVEDVDGYIKAVQTILILKGFHHGYAMVIDVSGCGIQSQETLDAFRRHMAAMPKAHRLAVIVGNSLALGQVRRLFTQDYARLVATRKQALAWAERGIDPVPKRTMTSIRA